MSRLTPIELLELMPHRLVETFRKIMNNTFVDDRGKYHVHITVVEDELETLSKEIVRSVRDYREEQEKEKNDE